MSRWTDWRQCRGACSSQVGLSVVVVVVTELYGGCALPSWRGCPSGMGAGTAVQLRWARRAVCEVANARARHGGIAAGSFVGYTARGWFQYAEPAPASWAGNSAQRIAWICTHHNPRPFRSPAGRVEPPAAAAAAGKGSPGPRRTTPPLWCNTHPTTPSVVRRRAAAAR